MIIFLVILFILLLIFTKKTKENFSSNDIKTEINNIYRADIETIRNLSNYASYLMNGSNNTNSVTVPGIIKATNKLCINDSCLTKDDIDKLIRYTQDGKIAIGPKNNKNWNITSDGDLLKFQRSDYDWSGYDPNHKLSDHTDKPLVVIAGDGNIWSDRSLYKGWIPDNMKNIHPDSISIGDKSKNHWKISTDGDLLKIQRSDYDWTGFDSNNKPPTSDKPLVVIARDGNIWTDRSKNKGWIADHLENTVRFDQGINLRSLGGPKGARILSSENGSSNEIGATWRPHDHPLGSWEALRILRSP